MDAIRLQQDYYTRTAGAYDALHLANVQEPEHNIALATLSGLAGHYGFKSFLDVGCGTGRGVEFLRDHVAGARVEGIEPVLALRQAAYAKGISSEVITDGDALAIRRGDGAYDCVTAFGILHHIRTPRLAIAEMLRVAKRGVFLSDLNSFGCGSFAQRTVSQSLNALGLWKLFQRVLTRGKGYKISEGDGLHYSYSLYNDLPFLESRCREVHVMNTRGKGRRSYRTCSHLAVLALK